jgi:2,3-bisphosphoglycerate-dependent phosphoglycerate mutase
MTVGFRVGGIIDEVGTSDFLHAFFSTISFHLEPEGWGTRYPELMNELYQGKLEQEAAEKVLKDVATIREQLKEFPPSDVVWDMERPDATPPWGDDISTDITDLSRYFVTSTGRDIFEVLIECLEALKSEGGCMTVDQV